MYRLRKGRKVKIFDVDQTTFLGIGVYIGAEKVEGMRLWIPRFKLGRRKIWGCECWWIPETITNRIEKKAMP